MTDHTSLWTNSDPSFSEPWHAEAFAVTMQLSRAGYFSWEAWVEKFSAQIKASPQLAEESPNEAYFRQWMQALNSLLLQSGLLSEQEISDYSEHWRRSYFHTAHGSAIEFSKDRAPIPPGALAHLDHHHHSHHHHVEIKPVAVDAATG